MSLTFSTERLSSSMEAVTCCTEELCCWAPEASVCELSAITREPSPNCAALSVIWPIAERTFSTTALTAFFRALKSPA